jgi:TPR repeat protein
MKLFRTAADAGSGAAMNAIGYMYANGDGVDRDDQQALAWYLKSATSGNYSRAMDNVAKEYESGAGTGADPDLSQARLWYQKAAAAGDPDARTWLASHPATQPVN